MNQQVVGSANSGTVHLHMAKEPGHPDWQYQLLAIDVQGMYGISSARYCESSIEYRPSKALS